MDPNESDVVIPVLKEELHADAVPVETGGVRVTKRVHSHEQIVEQELRKGRVDVKRVQVNRPVEGPLSVRRSGNTLIVPVVSEEIRVERHWVLTEEIHITHLEEVQTVQQAVPINEEEAVVERMDATGKTIENVAPEAVAAEVEPPQEAEPAESVESSGPPSILSRKKSSAPQRVLSKRSSIVPERPRGGRSH